MNKHTIQRALQRSRFFSLSLVLGLCAAAPGLGQNAWCGLPDMDGDGIPDKYDGDRDGDGQSNTTEEAAGGDPERPQRAGPGRRRRRHP